MGERMGLFLVLFFLPFLSASPEFCDCQLRPSRCPFPSTSPSFCSLHPCEEFVCVDNNDHQNAAIEKCILSSTWSFVANSSSDDLVSCEEKEVKKAVVLWAHHHNRHHQREQRQKRQQEQQQQGVKGWLVERLFHSEAIECPWTSSPSSDLECQERTNKIESFQHKLGVCSDPYQKSLQSIGHRGSPLLVPEETKVSYELAIEQGAGYIECDASYTKDGVFVCRHNVCDLQTTTNILANHSDLAEKCSVPFVPATPPFKKAQVKCCTYDFTLRELKQLCAIMDSKTNENARTPQEYLLGPASYQSDAFQSQGNCYPIMSFDEHLQFAKEKEMNVIPELKDTTDPDFNDFLISIGMTYEDLALQFYSEVYNYDFTNELGEFEQVAILQTFDRRVAKYWAQLSPLPNILYLWSKKSECLPDNCGSDEVLIELRDRGVQIFAPSLTLFLENNGHLLTSSEYIHHVADLIGSKNHLASWTLERSACNSYVPTSQIQPSNIGPCGGYYSGLYNVSVFQEADVLNVMDILFAEMNLLSLFSDFPSTVSAYSNCIFK